MVGTKDIYYRQLAIDRTYSLRKFSHRLKLFMSFNTTSGPEAQLSLTCQGHSLSLPLAYLSPFQGGVVSTHEQPGFVLYLHLLFEVPNVFLPTNAFMIYH